MSELITRYCAICGDKADFDEKNFPAHYICSDCAQKDKETDLW